MRKGYHEGGEFEDAASGLFAFGESIIKFVESRAVLAILNARVFFFRAFGMFEHSALHPLA